MSGNLPQSASIDEAATRLYCFADDFLKAHPRLAHWRRSNNDEPTFTDAEVLTLALMQRTMGCATLKRTHALIWANGRALFPALCSYSRLVVRLRPLIPTLGAMLRVGARAEAPQQVVPFVCDAKPIPLVARQRFYRARLLRDDGAYFGKTSAGWFFGFKLHLIVRLRPGEIADEQLTDEQLPMIETAMLTPGNWTDRRALIEMAPLLRRCRTGLAEAPLLADDAYHGGGFAEALARYAAFTVVTPKDVDESQRALISTVRQRVETTLSSLCRGLIDRICPRSFAGLWRSVLVRLVGYNLYATGMIDL